MFKQAEKVEEKEKEELRQKGGKKEGFEGKEEMREERERMVSKEDRMEGKNEKWRSGNCATSIHMNSCKDRD